MARNRRQLDGMGIWARVYAGLRGEFRVSRRHPNRKQLAHEPLERRDLLSAGQSAALQAVNPLGSLVYDEWTSGTIETANGVDRFSVDLAAEQAVSLQVDSAGSLLPKVELYDSSGMLLGTASADDSQSVLLQAVTVSADGTYTVVVGGLGASTGDYTVGLVVNAVLEDENAGMESNDSMVAAQDLDSAFWSPDAGTVQRAAVLGTLPGYGDSFESGQLGTAWTTSASSQGVVEVADYAGAADGAYALMMYSLTGAEATDEAQSAIWQVDLEGVESPILTFYHGRFYEETDDYFRDASDDRFADGVAISDDGIRWHSIDSFSYNVEAETWVLETVDLAAEAAAAGMELGDGFLIRFQQYADSSPGNALSGRGFDQISITSGVGEDWYRFSLADGQSASVTLDRRSYGSVALDLYDAAGNLLATGVPAENVDLAISNFVDATSDGLAATYFVRVTGEASDYSLIVSRDSDFEATSAEDGFSSPGYLASGRAVQGAVYRLSGEAATSDTYQFDVVQGDNLRIETLDISGKPFSYPEYFDAQIELLDPAGQIVATDLDVAADGSHALITHQADETGTYTVRVSGQQGSQGEYILLATGQTGDEAGLQVASSSADEDAAATDGGSLVVHFSAGVLLTTLDPGDLQVDGRAADEVTVIDGNTAVFSFTPALTAGSHRMTIESGALLGLDGSSVEAYEASFEVSPFEILGVTAGAETVGTVPTLDITFSDDLAVNSVDAEDFLINGVPAESVRVFNSTTIRVQPRVLTSGTWDLQVAAGAVTDLQGTALEAFSTSVTVTSADALLSDGLLHETRFLGELDTPGQIDSWQVQLEAGQRMTTLLALDDDLAGTVRLLGPDGSQVAAETGSAGQLVAVEYTAASAGTYTLAVSGADGTQGEYEGSLFLNAIVDLETAVYTEFKNATYVSGLGLVTSADLDSPGSTDTAHPTLGAGQTLTATIEVDKTLAASVRVLAPDGTEVLAKTAAGGQTLVFEYTATTAGVHRVIISGASGTTGEFECTLYAEGFFVEDTSPGTANNGAANDSAASAVALDSVFFDIADGGQAATVRGALDCSTTFVTEEDFTPGGGEEPETDFLLNGWWVDANRGELPRPRLGYGDGVLSFPAGYYESASQTEDIAGYYEANWSRGIPYNVETTNAITLEFDFRVSDADVRFTPFSGAFSDEANATGIAISNDEDTWYPVWNAQLQTVGEWVHYSIDLSAAAEAAGITLSNLTRIRFQYYAPVGTEGTGDESIAFDNLVVSDKVATEEWYQFDLAAGQTVAAVADSDESIQIDVLDAQLNVVASGAAGAGVQQAIDQLTASTSGTYYLRVTGTGGVYSLAVACDASAGWAQSVTVPEYVVGPRLAEHTVFPTTPSDGSSDGYGQQGTSIEFGTSATVTDLGTVLYQEVSDLDLSAGTLSFQLQSAHTAYMTVIGDAADSGTLQLKLTDVQSGETVYSVDVDGEQRLDLSAEDDRTYILEVTGTATNANLRLLNLVDRRDASVTVYGTDDADDVVFDATTGLDVSIQGITYPFRGFDSLVASFEGEAGDKVTLIGSTGDEEVNLTPDRATMTGEGWRVSVYNVTCYEVFGGGGSDTASLYDSAGNDRYESRPGLTTMTGPGFDMTVNDFETCHGYAKAGGVDTAVLYNPGGASKFKSDAEAGYAKLYGPDSFTRAKFFEVVEAYNTGDLGVARMFDSSGNDRFSAKDSQRRLITSKYDFIVYGFTDLIVTSRAGGRDTATLSDSVPDGEVLLRGFTDLDAGVEEDAGSAADGQDTSLATTQQDVVAPNTDTALVGPCSTNQTAYDGTTSTFVAVLADDDQTFDPLILAEVESNNTITTATALPLGFETLESEAIRIEGDLSGTDSCDYFRLELDAGDVFSARISGDAERVTLLDGRGVTLIRSAYDAGWNYPAESPLAGDGRASVSWVVGTAGVYYVRVSEGTGEYQLDLEVFRPKLESEPVGTRQVLYLDFDGAFVDTSEFREDGDVRELSPLSDFLSDLGLDPDQDLDAVIDAIVATVTENLSLSIRESGLNGDFDASGNPGEFDIVILNSRDDGEQYGNANVTRVVIGGTVEEFGINTVGMASSIDVGNFDTEETAVVLLDMLTDPDPESWNTASLNAVAIDPSADMIELVGRAIGNIASHEAGHLFGLWHTWNDNQRDVLTDTGGDYAATFGLGPDGIFGTDDDVDVDLGYDVYSPAEPYQGMQDSLAGLAFGLSTGTQVSSSSTDRSEDDSAE